MRSFTVLGIALVSGLIFGCSSSDASTGKSDAGVVTGMGDVLPDGGCKDTTMVPYGSKCLTKSAATTQCIADTTKRYPGIKTSDTTCGAGCTCAYCAAEIQQCGTDYACTAIVKCANDNNCVNTACYLAPGGGNGPCKELIDHADNDAGIGSAGVGLAQLVNACATKTKIGNLDFSNRPGPVCNASCN